MEIQFTELRRLEGSTLNEKQKKSIDQFEKLLTLLKEREIPQEVASQINREIEKFNSFQGSAKDDINQLKKSYANVLKILEKELKLVTKHHYRNTWMVLGMSIFGVPIGIGFSVAADNYGLLGSGFAVGMGIGIALGAHMDKKAEQNKLQLDLN